ncbi:hypothetical protein Vretimale_3838, partial [Volvox reticuliferus]
SATATTDGDCTAVAAAPSASALGVSNSLSCLAARSIAFRWASSIGCQSPSPPNSRGSSCRQPRSGSADIAKGDHKPASIATSNGEEPTTHLARVDPLMLSVNFLLMIFTCKSK